MSAANNPALLRAVADLTEAHPELQGLLVIGDAVSATPWSLADALRVIEVVGGEWARTSSPLHSRTALVGTFGGHKITVHLQLEWATTELAPSEAPLVPELARAVSGS